jgi:hypothetical protein
MSISSKASERFKQDLLGELRLMTPDNWQAYWSQILWPKPNLADLAKRQSSPLGYALARLPPEILAEASEQPDPFGWLLESVDAAAWIEYCHAQHKPWLVRVWLAGASQLLAERRLVHKAHGWAENWYELQRNPDQRRYADNLFLVQLRYASPKLRAQLLVQPGLAERIEQARQEGDQAFLWRFRRAKQGKKPAPATATDKFIVQYWSELPEGFPGLCFFNATALHDLLAAFELHQHEDHATKQLRVRLGLVQAGSNQHLIETVLFHPKLTLKGSMITKPYRFGTMHWNGVQLWPRPL